MTNEKSKQFQQFEPKKENRFMVEFGDPFKIPEYVIHEASIPSLTLKNCGYKWNDMIFVMYDPIAPSTSQFIMDGLQELRKRDSQIIDISIKLLDPVGTVINEWKVTGEIDYIDFGRLSWQNDEPLKIKINFKVNNAILLY